MKIRIIIEGDMGDLLYISNSEQSDPQLRPEQQEEEYLFRKHLAEFLRYYSAVRSENGTTKLDALSKFELLELFGLTQIQDGQKRFQYNLLDQLLTEYNLKNNEKASCQDDEPLILKIASHYFSHLFQLLKNFYAERHCTSKTPQALQELHETFYEVVRDAYQVSSSE